MPRLTRRNKVISIRLSNDEYDQLQTLCLSKGADSISELTRAAMKLLLAQEAEGHGHGQVESQVTEMQQRVTALDREVARLTSLMGLARMEEAQ
jgi:Arc/MetJ-type ribon-helix-helix transcriptional regulator